MNLPIERLSIPGQNVIAAARQAADELGIRVALVGGAVRDLILGADVQDIDLVAEGDTASFAARLAEILGTHAHSHERFLTFRMAVAGLDPVDVVTARVESYASPGALPVVSRASIEADLSRRDFTLNCLAWDLMTRELLDPLNGLADLRERRLRILHDGSFTDDPTRLFRLLRLAARFDFAIVPETLAHMRIAIECRSLRTVSSERVRREVDLALREERAGAVLEAFASSGILGQVIPTAAISGNILQRIQHDAAALECNGDLAMLAALDPEDDNKEPLARLWGAGRAQEILRIRREAGWLTRLAARTGNRMRLALGVAGKRREAVCLVEPDSARRLLTEMVTTLRDVVVDAQAVVATGVTGRRVGSLVRSARAAAAAGVTIPADASGFARERALKYLSGRRRP